MNNTELFAQIKALMMNDFQNQKLRKEDTRRYFVRNGGIQKEILKDSLDLMADEDSDANSNVIPKAALSMIFKMVEQGLGKYQCIDYAHIELAFKYDDKTGFDKLMLGVENERHHGHYR